MSFLRACFIIFIIPFIFGCVEKTRYSGKILNEKDLDIKILDKNELFKKFGQPSYVDELLNKYFYFTEMSKDKNFYNKKIHYSYLFVFEIDDSNKIINSETINLLTNKDHQYKNLQTENNILKRGLLEKIFGGIGPNNQLLNSP